MKWDYIIVGAGSAGCALAYELVKSGRTVLIIEAGGSDRSPVIKFPAGTLNVSRKFDWGYKAQPDPSRNGVEQRWARGRVVGGSSSINGMIYVRGAAQDFDRWSAQCGGQGKWSAAEVMPIYREFENSDQGNSLRGRSGPLYVRTVRRPHEISQAFVKSACAAGNTFNEDYNGYSQEGVSYIQFSQRRGLRWSAADAFLKPSLSRKNLRLLLNVSVDKIELANGRAVAVVFQHKGQQCREEARDIILCAGAINSPKLLMLSGIGDAEELKRHNVEVSHDLPAVGRNLKDHQFLILGYRSKIPTYNLTEGLSQKLAIAAEFLLKGEGPISNLFESIAFLNSCAPGTLPNLQVFFTAIGYLRMPDSTFKLAPYSGVTVGAANSYPVSSGRVRLASRNPSDPPVIEYSLLEDQADIDSMVRSIRVMRRIMSGEPIASLIDKEVMPGPEVESPSELESYVRDRTNICYHSIGTCRMGIGADAVVGPDLRVRGIENLWIADASIVPSPISANMNAPCIMIGMKLGKQLVARD
jgi:choline dehydrogenase